MTDMQPLPEHTLRETTKVSSAGRLSVKPTRSSPAADTLVFSLATLGLPGAGRQVVAAEGGHGSVASPTPSPSESCVSSGSRGATSSALGTPSPSQSSPATLKAG